MDGSETLGANIIIPNDDENVINHQKQIARREFANNLVDYLIKNSPEIFTVSITDKMTQIGSSGAYPFAEYRITANLTKVEQREMTMIYTNITSKDLIPSALDELVGRIKKKIKGMFKCKK